MDTLPPAKNDKRAVDVRGPLRRFIGRLTQTLEEYYCSTEDEEPTGEITATFTNEEWDLMCGAVLYRLVAFKRAEDRVRDHKEIAAHQRVYEALLEMVEPPRTYNAKREASKFTPEANQ